MGYVNPMMEPTSADESKRMKLMRTILQKALDASVHKASLIDMSSPELESNGQHVIQTIRQRIEAQFDVLCAQFDLNAKFTTLEALLDWTEQSQMGHEVGLTTTSLDATKPMVTPEELMQKERMRLMQQEKARLQQHLQQLRETNAMLEQSVHEAQTKGSQLLAGVEACLDTLGAV
ncbi:Aste57867_9292 [Aphanomyces stellatus]|uniref:Aste57867_9292 protein n=1 Tax=Aphanomyces stellatus TaxID=120398 RepID=A0A485KMY1_9STRA|nr:hypothetical protein As57867_009256 [Aphanomyces stellatus]VFT86174.1 Aste57867_9292 [Aphanomyces stellatus]